MFNTEVRIAEHENRIHKLEMERGQAQARAYMLTQHGKRYANQLQTYYSSLLAGNQQTTLNALGSRCVFVQRHRVCGRAAKASSAYDQAQSQKQPYCSHKLPPHL